MDCLPTRTRAATRWSLVLVAAGCSLATSCAATNSELALLGAAASGIVVMDDDDRDGLFDHVGNALLDELTRTILLNELGDRPAPVYLHELEGYRRLGVPGGDMALYAPLVFDSVSSATD